MYTIFGNSNVELCKDVGKIDTPKICLKSALGKTFMSLDNVSKFKFMHTLSESKNFCH